MRQHSRMKGWGCLVSMVAVATWLSVSGAARAEPAETPPGDAAGAETQPRPAEAQPRPAEAPPATESPAEVKPPPARATAGPAAAAAPARGVAPKPYGLYFEVGLGGELSAYTSHTSSSQKVATAFLVGYKIRRLILALGLEYIHSGSYDEAGGIHDHTVIHSMLFEPTLQYHLIESAPLAFYATAALHVGFSVYDDTSTSADDDTSTALVGFAGGLGFRYFFHPRFAVGVEGGVRGLWIVQNYDPPGAGSSKSTTAVVGVYGRIGFVIIW